MYGTEITTCWQQLWEEFREAMERDFWLAPRCFSKSVWILRRWETRNHLSYAQQGWDTVDLDWGSNQVVEGAIWGIPEPDKSTLYNRELEDDGGSTSVSLQEVTEVVKQLHSGKAPDIDEICLDMLKVLGVDIKWKSGTKPKEWQTEVVVSPVQKE